MNSNNLLIIGAFGGVGISTLLRLKELKYPAENLFLIDGAKFIPATPSLGEYLQKANVFNKFIDLPKDAQFLANLLSKHSIDVVVDLSELSCLEMLSLCNSLQISYLNTAATTTKDESVYDTIYNLIDSKNEFVNNTHILVSGMNPGVINLWAAHALKEFGKPMSIQFIEFDDSTLQDWTPIITWSPNQYLIETVKENGGYMLGRRKVKLLKPNSIKNTKNLPDLFLNTHGIKDTVLGCPIFHEECVLFAEKLDIPVSFLYAIDQRTTKYIYDSSLQTQKYQQIALKHVASSSELLKGSDRIMSLLTYPDFSVIYENTVNNHPSLVTNATYYQVSAGVIAGIITLLDGKLGNGLYFPEDLVDTIYQDVVFDLLPTRKITIANGKKDETTIPSQNKNYSF